MNDRTVSKAALVLRWLPAAAWMGVIFRLSAIPGSQIPGKYGTLAHFVSYSILGALLTVPLAYGRSRGETVALAVVFASLYAITDEFHQSFVPLRTPDIADWGVDTLGAFFGAFALTWLAELARRRTADAEKPQ